MSSINICFDSSPNKEEHYVPKNCQSVVLQQDCQSAVLANDSRFEDFQKNPILVDLLAKLFCGSGKPIVNEEYFKEMVSAVKSSIGNIALRNGLDVQEGSEKFVSVLSKIIMELLKVAPGILNLSIDVIKKLLQDFIDGVYSEVTRTAAEELIERSRFCEETVAKIFSMTGKPLEKISTKDLMASAYTFVTITEIDGILEIRVQLRYSQNETDSACTFIRDQGFTILYVRASNTFLCFPIQSYAKIGQDCHGRRGAANLLDPNQLVNALHILSDQTGFFDKLDGSLVRVGFTVLFNGEYWEIFVAASTAGSGVRALSRCSVLDMSIGNQLEKTQTIVEDIALSWEQSCRIEKVRGLREALVGVFLNFLKRCLDLDLESQEHDFQETFTLFGELILPNQFPGSVGTTDEADNSPIFQIHNPYFASYLCEKGHDVFVNESYESFTERISDQELSVLGKILNVTLRPGLTWARLMVLLEAIHIIRVWVRRPVAEMKGIDLKKALEEYFGDTFTESRINFKSADLKNRLNSISDYIIYRFIKNVQLPEGCISYRVKETDNLCGYTIEHYLKLKNTLWNLFHNGSTHRQFECIYKHFTSYSAIIGVSRMMDDCIGVVESETTKSIQSRTASFMSKTGSFGVLWEFIMETRSLPDYLPLVDLIMSSFKAEYLSALVFIKNNVEESNSLADTMKTIYPNGFPGRTNLDFQSKTMEAIIGIKKDGNGYVLDLQPMLHVPGHETTLSTAPLSEDDLIKFGFGDHELDCPEQLRLKVKEFQRFVDGQLALRIASGNGSKRFDALATVLENQNHLGSWFESIAGKFVDQILEFPALFILLDWDGTAEVSKELRDILMNLALESGVKLCILTGNKNLDCCSGYFGENEDNILMCSIGDVLIREGVHPFMIPHLTAQVKAWVMSELRRRGGYFVLIDDSKNVMQQATDLCVQDSVIPFNNNTGDVLIHLINLLADKVDEIIKNKFNTSSKGDRPEILKEISTDVQDFKLLLGLLQTCSVYLTKKEMNFETAMKVIGENHNLSGFTNIFLRQKDILTPVSELTFPLKITTRRGYSSVITIEGDTGSGKSVFATAWEIIHGGIHLNQDGLNYPKWTAQLQSLGNAMRRRIANLLPSLGVSVILSSCKLPKGISGDVSFVTDNKSQLTNEEIEENLILGRRLEIALNTMKISKDVDSPRGPPEDIGKVIFAAIEDDGLGKNIFADLRKNFGVKLRHQSDWKFNPRSGPPHFATRFGYGVCHHRSQDDGKLCEYVGLAIYTNSKDNTETSFFVVIIPNGEVVHETINAKWYSGGGIHTMKLTEIAKIYIDALPKNEFFEHEILPGITLKVIGFEKGRYTMPQKSYYHLASPK